MLFSYFMCWKHSHDSVNAQNLLTLSTKSQTEHVSVMLHCFLNWNETKNLISLSITNSFPFGASMKHRPDDISGRTSAFLFMFWDSVPREDQSPIKSSDLRFSRVAQELKVFQSITSITGHTTAEGSSFILQDLEIKKGGRQILI